MITIATEKPLQTALSVPGDPLKSILKSFPKPWMCGVNHGTDEAEYALTPNGRNALLGILFLVGDYPILKRAARIAPNDKRAFLLVLNDATEALIDEYKKRPEDEPSCVCELTNGNFSLMLAMLSIQLEGEAAHA